MALLELDDVTVRHDGRTVLRVEHLVVDERRVGVVGANGSGKSTLLRLLNGLVAPATGQVRVAGLDTVRDGREVRRRVGLCFQDPADQIVMPVVADDIAFGLKNRGVPTAERDVLVAAVLDRFGIAHLADRAASTLSGGEKQMVALAAVLVTEPTTVLFDEPTGTLDLARSLRFAQVLAGLDVQAVVATHDLTLLDGSTGHPVDGSTGHPVDGSTGHPVDGSTGHPVDGSTGHPVDGSTGHPADGSTGLLPCSPSDATDRSGHPTDQHGPTAHLARGFDRVLVLDHGQIVADDKPGPALAGYRELAARACTAQHGPTEAAAALAPTSVSGVR